MPWSMRVVPPVLRLIGVLLLVGFVFGLANELFAQAPTGPDTTESTTDDSTGIVTGVAPHRTITVGSRRGPFTYRLGQDLHITGPDNRALKITEAYPGNKATAYYYVRDGQQTVGRIVVLQRGKTARK